MTAENNEVLPSAPSTCQELERWINETFECREGREASYEHDSDNRHVVLGVVSQTESEAVGLLYDVMVQNAINNVRRKLIWRRHVVKKEYSDGLVKVCFRFSFDDHHPRIYTAPMSLIVNEGCPPAHSAISLDFYSTKDIE